MRASYIDCVKTTGVGEGTTAIIDHRVARLLGEEFAWALAGDQEPEVSGEIADAASASAFATPHSRAVLPEEFNGFAGRWEDEQ